MSFRATPALSVVLGLLFTGKARYPCIFKVEKQLAGKILILEQQLVCVRIIKLALTGFRLIRKAQTQLNVMVHVTRLKWKLTQQVCLKLHLHFIQRWK